MNKICDFFLEKSNKNLLIITSLIFLLFMILVLPPVSRYTEDLTGSASSPDTSLLYSSDDLFDMAETYGEEGRDAYILLRFTFDIVWPIVYLMFLVSFISLLIKNLNLKEKYKYLILLPLFGVIFDFLENISSVIVMHKYPVEMVFFANLAPIMTLIKWGLIGISFSSIIVLVIIFMFKKELK